jgi:hypothetical protein
MIIGAHIMIQSLNEKADQAFLSNVLKLGSVDAGGGFFIYGVPPAEVAIHAGEANDEHQLFLMCDDVEAFVADMQASDIHCSAPANRGWGTLTEITLPGGGRLGVYQPHHPRPKSAGATPAKRKAAAKKKAAPKKKAAKAVARKAPAKKKSAKKAARRGKRR